MLATSFSFTTIHGLLSQRVAKKMHFSNRIAVLGSLELLKIMQLDTQLRAIVVGGKRSFSVAGPKTCLHLCSGYLCVEYFLRHTAGEEYGSVREELSSMRFLYRKHLFLSSRNQFASGTELLRYLFRRNKMQRYRWLIHMSFFFFLGLPKYQIRSVSTRL